MYFHFHHNFKLMFNYITPSAALHGLTKNHAPYRWFVFTLGRYFFGFMRCDVHKVIMTEEPA